VPTDEQRRRIEKVSAGEAWILDTAYGKWIDVPLARVQLIVALDFPRWLSLLRLSRRTIARLIDRKPICNGNRESLRMLFSRNSIIGWHFKSFSNKRRRIRMWATDPTAPDVLRFTRPSQLKEWLAFSPLYPAGEGSGTSMSNESSG
jgi:adenylate kinase family enzyme